MLGGVSGVFPRPITLSAMLCLPATRRTVLPEVEAPSPPEEAPLLSPWSRNCEFQIERSPKNKISQYLQKSFLRWLGVPPASVRGLKRSPMLCLPATRHTVLPGRKLPPARRRRPLLSPSWGSENTIIRVKNLENEISRMSPKSFLRCLGVSPVSSRAL